MTQEEIIKLAHAAGFNWPDIQATTIEQRLERFAALVAATEREKFTNTQEFVTLPREVVEQALKVLEYAANDVLTGRNAATALRAALEQPDHSEQSYMGCVTSDMHELAEWLNTMYEDSKEQIAALEQPQNHVPDVGNMVQAGWKPVPVEPTEAMLDAGCEAVDGPDWTGPNAVYRAMLDAAPQPPVVGQLSMTQAMRDFIDGMSVSVDVSTGEHDAGHRYFGTVTEVMDAPEDKHGVTLLVQDAEPNFERLQGEQEPVAWMFHAGDIWKFRWHHFNRPMGDDALKYWKPIFTHPQPPRQPLSEEAICDIWRAKYTTWIGAEQFMHIFQAAEAAHNIK